MELTTLAQLGLTGAVAAASAYGLWKYAWLKKKHLIPSSLLLQESELAARFSKHPISDAVKFGKVKVPASSHFMVVGDSDAQLAGMATFFETRREAGDTLIVLDEQGMALERYFNEEFDFILNGKDARSVSWSPFSEVTEKWQVAGLVDAMLASHAREGVHHSVLDAAKLLCHVIIVHLMESNDLTVESFITLALGASLKELQSKLTDVKVHALLHTPASFVAARGVMADAINEYMTIRQKGLSFSVSEMLKAQHNGALFVTFDGDEGSKALALCILSQALTALLDLRGKIDASHKIWVIIPHAEGLLTTQVMKLLLSQGKSLNCFGVFGVNSITYPAASSFVANSWCLAYPGEVPEADRVSLALSGGFIENKEACVQVLGSLPQRHGVLLMAHNGSVSLGIYGTSPLRDPVVPAFELRDLVAEPYLAPKVVFTETIEDTETPAQPDLLQGMSVVKQLTPDEAFLKKMPKGSRILLRTADVGTMA